MLGCADVAARRVLPAAAAVPGLVIRAVASRSASRAAVLAGRYGADPVTGYQHLLDRPDIDAVYLPLPSGLHERWIRRTLDAGKHVLAEKPLTTSAAATAGLLELARERGLVLMENYMFLRHGQHAAVRDLVARGAVGEPRAFFAAFTIPPRPAGDIRLQRELGGGALLDVAGYPLRAAQFFLGGRGPDGGADLDVGWDPGASADLGGRDIDVAGAVLRHDEGLGVDVGGAILLHCRDGVPAQLTFGLENGYVSNYQIWGSEGRIGVEHVFTTPADHQPVVRVDRQDHHERIVLPAEDQVAVAVAEFARAVRTGHGDPPGPVLTQARLLDRARQLAGAGAHQAQRHPAQQRHPKHRRGAQDG